MFQNNYEQKMEQQSAAARLAQLPLVRSACRRLSVLYTDTKRFHPGLTSVCGVLEGRVTAAYVTVSPVIGKLEPHISIVNAVACKSLDWLEASFPFLRSPTDQIVSSAKSKLYDLQDAVQHRLIGVTTGSPRGHDGVNLVKKAVTMADVGLDSALCFSEALLDHVLPPEEDEDETEGFGVAKVPKCYSERVVTLVVRLWRRTSCLVGSQLQPAPIYEGLSSPALMQDRQTSCLLLIWKLQALPLYLERQALSVMYFVFRMYHLIFSSSQQADARRRLKLPTSSSQSNLVRWPRPPPTPRRVRHTRLSMFDEDEGCSFEGRLHR